MTADTIIITFETDEEAQAMRDAIKNGPHYLSGPLVSEIDPRTFECFKPSNALARAFNEAIAKAKKPAAPIREVQSSESADAPATEKQIAFIHRLVLRDPAYASNFISTTDGLTKRGASLVIENLLAGA